MLTSDEDLVAFIRDYYAHLDRPAHMGISPLEEARQRGRTAVLSLLIGTCADHGRRVSMCRLVARRFPNRAKANLSTLS